MPGCVPRLRRHRRRPDRTPTFGKYVRSRLAITHFSFPNTQGLRRSDTVASSASPAAPPLLVSSITRHLRGLYDGLKDAGDKALGPETFDAFVRNIQKQGPHFPSSHPYSFDLFLDTWCHHYSRAKRPTSEADKDLDRPISNYFISSSHNTYIGHGDQIFGKNRHEQYKKERNVLDSGCRCVEIDVWNAAGSADLSVVSNREKPSPPSSHNQNKSKKNDKDKKKKKREKGEKGEKGEKRHRLLAAWLPCNRTQGRYAPPHRQCAGRLHAEGMRRKRRSYESSDSFEPKLRARSRLLSDADYADLLKREPRVCHAYRTPAGDKTAGEPVPFRTVCRMIRSVAFTHNSLPLIISLEVHTTGLQQDLMVDIMKKEWQGLLLHKPLPACDPEARQPNLSELRGKILVKVKRGCLITRDDKATPSTSCSPDPAAPPPPATQKRQAKGVEVRQPLHELGIYVFGGPFRHFDSATAAKPAHVFSFGEERIKALHRTRHEALFSHNKRYLARTYPENFPLSTNPNYPTLFWRKGVQMVALNWQSWDTAMHLNEAMFDGEDGWVLKPAGYQSDSPAACQARVDGKRSLHLCITVLGGQAVPAPYEPEEADGPAFAATATADALSGDAFRPRVKCYLHVESHAERNHRKKMASTDEICKTTEAARTSNPDWGAAGSRLQFPTVSHVIDELSFVRFRVEHCGRMRDQRTAWACIRLDRLQEGYRLIKLKTAEGYSSDGILLVKIEKKLSDEPLQPASLRARTWDAYKRGNRELSRLGSSSWWPRK